MPKRGSIHSEQVCPVCGSRFKNRDSKDLPSIPEGLSYPKGLFCPNHPHVSPTRFMIRFGKFSKRFSSFEVAEDFLNGLNFEKRTGTYDPRDYLIQSRPLSFSKIADEWLELKTAQIKKSSITSFKSGVERAQTKWGHTNIKEIKYADIEDFLNSYPGSSKTRLNISIALKQLFIWAADRYEISEIKKWPKIGNVQMAFRDTVDIHTQEAVLDDIKEHEPFRVWLCIKWLATYIAIRPGEMRGLKEGQVDRSRGILIIPHPKEKEPKIIPLLDEDIEIIRALPHAFDPTMPFFRHEKSIKGGTAAGDSFGHNVIYRSWKRACSRLGISGVSLYPGTKHSTAMGIRQASTFEEVRLATGHKTNKAFERYVRTEGNAMKEILNRRKSILDSVNETKTDFAANSKNQVFEFKR